MTNPIEQREAKRKPGAIVLGGNFVGLGVVRSLGRQGIPVWVVDADHRKSIAQFSRYTKRFIECKKGVVSLLLEEARQAKLDGWVIFPTSDEYVELLSANFEALSSDYRLAASRPEVTGFALDKRLTYQRAVELGIATPWTFTGQTAAELERHDPPYPLILKPAVNHHFFPHTNVKALPVGSFAELQQRFAQMSLYISPDAILAQERIPGGGENQFSLCALCKEGRVLASIVAQRRRQYPIEFGNASTFVQTVEQPIVEAAGRRFLENIGFDGIGEVEFKFDPRDSKFKILDANLRPWGWHTLGMAAGVDFAHLLFQQKTGVKIQPIVTHRKASWVREITDLAALAKSKNRFAELKSLFSAWASGKFTLATFSISDPRPFFAELYFFVTSGISRQKQAEQILQVATAQPAPGAVAVASQPSRLQEV